MGAAGVSMGVIGAAGMSASALREDQASLSSLDASRPRLSLWIEPGR